MSFIDYTNDKCTFIMLVGLPGSGKSTLSKNIKQQFPDRTIVLCHDQMIDSYILENKCGKNKARTIVHNNIVLALKTMDVKSNTILILDSVNFNSTGRLFFINCIPENVQINIIYFKPSSVIEVNNYETYVDWLHNSRKQHYKFPTNKTKAIKTMSNLHKIFNPLTPEELQYNIIYLDSYLK